MEPMYYIGLDVHKRNISYCVKDRSGQLQCEGSLSATRLDLDRWMKTLPQPWSAAMEATMFTGWIYDHLKPHAAVLKVAHPLMLRAIAAAKKKNDRIDASKICDCLRCDFLPECYIASTAIRERRRTLRYRNLLVRQMVQIKIKISSLLMEAGVSYNKQRLHKAGYFRELLAANPHIDEGLRSLLCQCREMVVRLGKMENALIRSLRRDRLLAERVERLMSIPAIGPITALTRALVEVGFPDKWFLVSSVVQSFAFVEQSPHGLFHLFEPLTLPRRRLQPAFTVDQKNCRILCNLSIKRRHPGCGGQEGVGNRNLSQKRLLRLDGFIRNTQYNKSARFPRLVEFVEQRHLVSTRRTPCRPDVYQHNLAFVIGQSLSLTLKVRSVKHRGRYVVHRHVP